MSDGFGKPRCAPAAESVQAQKQTFRETVPDVWSPLKGGRSTVPTSATASLYVRDHHDDGDAGESGEAKHDDPLPRGYPLFLSALFFRAACWTVHFYRLGSRELRFR